MKSSSFLFAVLTLLLIGNYVVNAAILKTEITESSFEITPKTVIDTSMDKDKPYAQTRIYDTYFSAGKQADILYAWLFYYNSSTMTVMKKTLNATTLKPIIDDISIQTNISGQKSVSSNIGYLGIASLKDQVVFSVIPTEATADTSPSEIQLTNDDDANFTHGLGSILFQNNIFYIVYVRHNVTGDNMIAYLQGVNATNMRQVYSEPIKIFSCNKSYCWPEMKAGLDNTQSATHIIVTWKDEDTNLVQKTINIAHGRVSDSVILQNSTDHYPTYWYALSIVSSAVSYGVVSSKLTFGQEVPEISMYLGYDGVFTNLQLLDLKTPNGYTWLSFYTTFINRDDGFIAAVKYEAKKKLKLMFRYFDDTGSAFGLQRELANMNNHTNVDNFRFFADASGALWLGYCDYDDTNYIIDNCSLGKLKLR